MAILATRVERFAGVSIDDMPDVQYRHWYDDGLSTGAALAAACACWREIDPPFRAFLEETGLGVAVDAALAGESPSEAYARHLESDGGSTDAR